MVQLLPHFSPVGAARGRLIARSYRASSRLRSYRTLLSLFVAAAAPGRPKNMA
jgi:hypothetical protein